MSGKKNISSCAFYYRASKPNTFKILGLANENFRNSAMLNNRFIVAARFGINTHVAVLALTRFRKFDNLIAVKIRMRAAAETVT